ncbi:MAG: hypothetical protein U0074_18865 [Kouleothrix sp.]
MARQTSLRTPTLSAASPAVALPSLRLRGRAASDGLRLLLVLIIALCQGALYLALLPPWQHYDEPTHFEYAWLIANHAGLPQPGAQDRAMRRDLAASMLEHHFYWNLAQPTLLDDATPIDVGVTELNHPPIYYMLVSAPLRFVRHQDLVSQLYIARAVSLLLFLLTIGVAGGLARELTPPGHDLRWALPLILALLPTFVDLMTAVNNDVGAVAIASVFLWGAARTIRRGLSWPRALWLFGSALIAVYTKNTAAVALPLALLVGLVAFWGRRGWRWRWLVGGILASALLVLPLAFAWGDAAYWYRGNAAISQAEPTRVETPDAPLGRYALSIAPPITGGMQSLVSPLADVDLHSLAGQKVTIGAWVWADQPVLAASLGVGYKPQLSQPATLLAHPIAVSEVPAFVAWTLTVPEQAQYLDYQIHVHTSQPPDKAVHLLLDGAILAVGEFPANQAPRFDDANATSGTWGGQAFTNLLRNPSAERGWPHLRATLDQLLVRYIHRSPSQTIAALLDGPRLAPLFIRTLLQPAADGMVQSFAWGHVRLSNSVWLLLSQALAFLALVGGIRWLWGRGATSQAMLRPTIVFLLIAGLMVWANTVLRPLPLLGEPYVIPSARYTFPAITVTLLVLLGGWRALWPKRWHTSVTFALIGGLILLNAVSIQTIFTFYQALP